MTVSFMQQALMLAEQAKQLNEVPVGAVVVKDNRVIGEGLNQVITLSDPCAHAEILALRQAGQRIGNYRLSGTTVYTTLEPCAMCAGALVHARIEHLIIAASDLKTGACGSVFNLVQGAPLNHKIEVTFGLLEQESRQLLQSFFRVRR
jgi:tRNA(adenine34) deaminase